MNNTKTRSREFEGLIETLESYNLTTGTIISEHEEEEQIIQKNSKSFTIIITPI